jgi:hypothetical protein
MKTNGNNKKILLALLPFWTPQIPPLGISCLKSFLQLHGYEVKTVDVNVEEQVRILYNKYFDRLREAVSEAKRGNFYNIGHEILQNHMMAHIHYRDEQEYIRVVKIVIKKTFPIEPEEQLVLQLNNILAEFYQWLYSYFLDLLEREKPSVLGLSVYKGTLPASMFAFKLAREKYPGILNVMGGAVFAQTLGIETENFDYFLKNTEAYIDKIIVGEGEILFLKLLQGELPPSQRVYSLADINGETLELASAVVPDFSDLNRQFYPNLATYTSRSCPFQCKFCTETVYWGTYRKKTYRQIVEELSTLYKEYDFQLFLMCDSLLNPVITGMSKELADSDLAIYWDGYLRVDPHACDADTVMLWRFGGGYRLRLGVESGSQRILDRMDKNISIDKIKTAVANIANAGIKATTYWIIGYPGETEEDFQQTLDLVEELRENIYEAECNPFGFYLSGQVNSSQWVNKNNIIPLYPDNARDMLILQSWAMDCKPSRQETYQRISRFVQHCSRLGIANPYSLYDISKADERWRKLHKNAVPPLLEFKNKEIRIDEAKKVKKIQYARNTNTQQIEFGF